VPLLVLAVCGGCATKRLSEMSDGVERCRRGIDPAGESCRDLLEEPVIAVGIDERRERAVGAVLRRGPSDPAARARLEPRTDGSFVEDLADLDTAGEELLPGGLDVGHDQVQALDRPR